ADQPVHPLFALGFHSRLKVGIGEDEAIAADHVRQEVLDDMEHDELGAEAACELASVCERGVRRFAEVARDENFLERDHGSPRLFRRAVCYVCALVCLAWSGTTNSEFVFRMLDDQ